jgi:hypothetical protein
MRGFEIRDTIELCETLQRDICAFYPAIGNKFPWSISDLVKLPRRTVEEVFEEEEQPRIGKFHSKFVLIGRKSAIWDKLMDCIVGCIDHTWSWPQTPVEMRNEYPSGYDSYQTCTTCGAMRLYNVTTFSGGPMFRERK